MIAPVGHAFGALRVAAAEVAFHDLARVLVVVHGAERAGDGADLAADADARRLTSMAPVAAFLVIASTGQACMHHASVALGAGIGDRAPPMLELEDLDPRLGRVEGALRARTSRPSRIAGNWYIDQALSVVIFASWSPCSPVVAGMDFSAIRPPLIINPPPRMNAGSVIDLVL